MEFVYLNYFEIVQYTTIFTIIVIFISKLLNTYVIVSYKDVDNDDDDDISIWLRIIHIIINLSIVTIVFFYIRKIGLLVPSIPSFFHSSFQTNTTLEYTEHIAIVVLFIEILPNLKKQIESLSKLLHE